MARSKVYYNIFLESLFIFASLFLILILVVLLNFVAQHFLTITENYSQLEPALQNIRDIRNTYFFLLAVFITVVTVIVQWIWGRLKAIDKSWKAIKEWRTNGRRRKKGKNGSKSVTRGASERIPGKISDDYRTSLISYRKRDR